MDSRGMKKTCKRPSASSRSVSQFQEPETHHVHLGQSIQQKLESMSSGDVCIIHEGLYKESIKITTRNITIKAEVNAKGERDTVLLHSSAELRSPATVIFNLCQNSCLEGIQVRNDSGVGIAVSKCSPEIKNCTITGATGGIKISKNNEYAQIYPVIESCRIHHCMRGPGITLQDAKAIIENNEIHHNNDAGIAYSGLSNPWINSNTIYNGNGAGLAIQGAATGIIRDNTIYNNVCAGIVVEGGSHPVIWKNHLRKGNAEGIKIDSGSKGMIHSNDLTDHASCEMMLASGCTSLVVNNSFHNCVESAIVIDKSSPVITGNSFHDIDSSCITITGNGTPSISTNTFSITSQPAITVGEHCNGSVEHNTFVNYPAEIPSPAICTKRGTFIRVHDNIVKQSDGKESPFDTSLQLPDPTEDDSVSDDDIVEVDSNQDFPPARRPSTFTERLNAISNKKNANVRPIVVDCNQRIPHRDTETSPSDHNDIAAGSAGAAVLMRKHFEFPINSGEDNSPSPTTISDIHLGVLDTPSLPVSPVHEDETRPQSCLRTNSNNHQTEKRVSLAGEDSSSRINGKNHLLEKLPTTGKIAKENSQLGTPTIVSVDNKVGKKKRHQSAPIVSTDWVDQTALRVLRASSTDKTTSRRDSDRETPTRSFISKPRSERSVSELSEIELTAELEVCGSRIPFNQYHASF